MQSDFQIWEHRTRFLANYPLLFHVRRFIQTILLHPPFKKPALHSWAFKMGQLQCPQQREGVTRKRACAEDPYPGASPSGLHHLFEGECFEDVLMNKVGILIRSL